MNADRSGVNAGAACGRFDAVLPELIGLDGEEPTISPAEKEELLRHVETCARCADARRAYAATVDLLRGLPRKNAPSDFLSWVSADLPEPIAGSPDVPRPRLWKPWIAIAAAVPLLAAAIYIVSIEGRRPAPEIAMAPAAAPSPDSLSPDRPSRPSPEREEQVRLEDAIQEKRSLPGIAMAPPAQPPGEDTAFRDRASPDRAEAALPLEPKLERRKRGAPDADRAAVGEVAPRSPPADAMLVLALPYIAGRWEADVASFEREVRGRFADPARNVALASRPSTPPGFGAPRGAVPSAPEARIELDAASKTLPDRADTEGVERQSSAPAAPAVREITVSVDPARLPDLESFVETWSSARLRVQARAASTELPLEEKLEASPRPPVRVRIRVEPLLPPASRDPKSP